VTGLEIFDHVASGQVVFHRDDDAWDLLDEDGLVAAVLCPRKTYLTVSLPPKRVPPKPAGRRMPYGEKKKFEISEDQLQTGRERIAALARGQRDSGDD
jgi:hypothetical protein